MNAESCERFMVLLKVNREEVCLSAAFKLFQIKEHISKIHRYILTFCASI